MKKRILNIAAFAFIVTTIGFLMDGDAKEPNMLMRFVEFVCMFAFISILIATIYFAFDFTKKRLQKA